MTSKNCTFTVKTDRHEWSMIDKVEATTQQLSEIVKHKSRTNKNLTQGQVFFKVLDQQLIGVKPSL